MPEVDPRQSGAGGAPCVLTNARLVLPTEVVRGTLVVRAGVIDEIDHTTSQVPGAIDLAGDYLIPGLVDLHTDNLERHYQPRSGVEWDAVSAAISHDTQIAGAGITTVYDSLTLGAASGWDMRAETIGPIVEGLRTAIAHDMLRVQHLLHMRCEVTHPEIVPIFEAYANDPLVRFMSLMDHAPGDRQSPDIAEYRRALPPDLAGRGGGRPAYRGAAARLENLWPRQPAPAGRGGARSQRSALPATTMRAVSTSRRRSSLGVVRDRVPDHARGGARRRTRPASRC